MPLRDFNAVVVFRFKLAILPLIFQFALRRFGFLGTPGRAAQNHEPDRAPRECRLGPLRNHVVCGLVEGYGFEAIYASRLSLCLARE